jgi:predicted aspartyl protease
MKKLKAWIVEKCGGKSSDRYDAMVKQYQKRIEFMEAELKVEKINYRKAAQALIKAGEIVRIQPNDRAREFHVQFTIDERLVWFVFDAGADDDSIERFSREVGYRAYDMIRTVNFIRPIEYRKN